MKQLFEKHREALEASNKLWHEVVELKDRAAHLQAEAASKIKGVYDEFHARIMDRSSLQGTVNLKLSDDGKTIVGLELGIPENSGFRRQTLLLKDGYENTNIPNDKEKAVETDEAQG